MTINLKESNGVPQIMLGLQGAPCTGKTWAASTFPNPTIVDFDRGTTALCGRDIKVVPFYDAVFVKEKFKAPTKQYTIEGIPTTVLNRRDAFRKWLDTDAANMKAGETLVIDSWTSLMNAFDLMTEAEPAYTKQGNVDEFAFWRRKIMWSTDVIEMLKSLSCNVVVCFHEIQQRDKATGILLDKVQPLMEGKFVAELKVHFTDYYRQCAIPKVKLDGKPSDVNGKAIDKDGWYWQVKSDAAFDAKCRVPNVVDKFVPAHYSFFEKAYSTTNK